MGNPDWWDIIFLPEWVLTIAAILVPRRVLHRVGWFCPFTMPVTTKLFVTWITCLLKAHPNLICIQTRSISKIIELDYVSPGIFVVITKVTPKNCTDRGPLKTMSGFFYKKRIFGDAGLSFWSGWDPLQISTVSLKFWGQERIAPFLPKRWSTTYESKKAGLFFFPLTFPKWAMSPV